MCLWVDGIMSTIERNPKRVIKQANPKEQSLHSITSFAGVHYQMAEPFDLINRLRN